MQWSNQYCDTIWPFQNLKKQQEILLRSTFPRGQAFSSTANAVWFCMRTRKDTASFRHGTCPNMTMRTNTDRELSQSQQNILKAIYTSLMLSFKQVCTCITSARLFWDPKTHIQLHIISEQNTKLTSDDKGFLCSHNLLKTVIVRSVFSYAWLTLSHTKYCFTKQFSDTNWTLHRAVVYFSHAKAQMSFCSKFSSICFHRSHPHSTWPTGSHLTCYRAEYTEHRHGELH